MDQLSLKRLIEQFLAEDIASGDLTTEAIFPADQPGEAVFIAQDYFIVAGMEKVAGKVFTTLNPAITIEAAAEDGKATSPGDLLLRIKGSVIDLLRAERVALNLAQRLCGVATKTFKFVEKVKPLPVGIVDTRKTTPGLRMLEKYAVRVGGGHNHRFSLADGVLIKDNHITACGSIRKAVERVRAQVPHTLKIEVEAESIEHVKECLACDVDIIMLDNMAPAMINEAVKLAKHKAILEASGGVDLDNIKEIAETGVDLISIGALTHSAQACDISMHYVSTPLNKQVKRKSGCKITLHSKKT